jgi:hypothetical protein
MSGGTNTSTAFSVSDSDIRTAIETFAPVYVFHPDERYLPLRFPTYVEGCSLMRKVPAVPPTAACLSNNTCGEHSETLVAFPNLTVRDLVNPDILSPHRDAPVDNIYLKIVDTQMVYGTPLNAPPDIRAVHYVYVFTVVVDAATVYLDLLFNLLYAYNCMAGDDHEFDSEYVIVRVAVREGGMTLVSMWTSRHGGGCWNTANQLTFDTNPATKSSPVVYVALGSHANYIIPGIQRRLWGFGNDICATQRCNVFRPDFVRVPKRNDADFPGDSSVDFMAYPAQTSPQSGSVLTAWKPKCLNTIETPPPKASDDTAHFIKHTVPHIGDYTFYAVLGGVLCVCALEILIFTKNTKSMGNATWQQLFVVALSFLTGAVATYAHQLI